MGHCGQTNLRYLPFSPFELELSSVHAPSKQSNVTQIPKCTVSVTFLTVDSIVHHLGQRTLNICPINETIEPAHITILNIEIVMFVSGKVSKYIFDGYNTVYHKLSKFCSGVLIQLSAATIVYVLTILTVAGGIWSKSWSSF